MKTTKITLQKQQKFAIELQECYKVLRTRPRRHACKNKTWSELQDQEQYLMCKKKTNTTMFLSWSCNWSSLGIVMTQFKRLHSLTRAQTTNQSINLNHINRVFTQLA